MSRIGFAIVKSSLCLFASSGITVSYIQCFGIGIACFAYDECGDYIP